MTKLSLLPDEDESGPPITGEALHAKLLGLVDLMRGCATTLDGAAQTALACGRADPLMTVEHFDEALDAIATGTGALKRQLEMFRTLLEQMRVTTSARPPAD